MPTSDPAVRAAANRRYYESNRDAAKARSDAKRARNEAHVHALKAGPCADCGQEYPHYVMDFAHLDEERIRRFYRQLVHNASLATIDAEVADFDLICANCRCERTWKRHGAVKRAIW